MYCTCRMPLSGMFASSVAVVKLACASSVAGVKKQHIQNKMNLKNKTRNFAGYKSPSWGRITISSTQALGESLLAATIMVAISSAVIILLGSMPEPSQEAV